MVLEAYTEELSVLSIDISANRKYFKMPIAHIQLVESE